MVDRPGWVPDDVDLTRPSVARVYDFYLGGSHNFEADRTFAQEILAALPSVPMLAQENRGFLRRVVAHLCAAGIDQFLDLGSGIPTVGNVHEVAQQANPHAQIIYVDHDPVAVAHSQSLLSDNDRAAAVSGDLRDPASIFTDPVLQAHLDLDRPVAVMMVAVLHFVDDDQHPAAFIAEYMRATAPGSYLVISHGSTDERQDMIDAQELYNNRAESPNSTRLRSHEEVTALFGNLTLVEPGVVRAPQWRPDTPDDLPPNVETCPLFAGVGRRD